MRGQQGGRSIGRRGAEGSRGTGDRNLNPHVSFRFPTPRGRAAKRRTFSPSNTGPQTSKRQPTEHGRRLHPDPAAVFRHFRRDFRVAEAAGRGAHSRVRWGPVYGVSWRGRRLGGRRRCPGGGLCPARMFPGLAAAVAAHRCSWAALCRLGGRRQGE